jgi:hypothetical protein
VTADDVTRGPAEVQLPAAHDTTKHIAYSHRFVSSSDTRKRFARAFLGHVYRTRRLWVFYFLVLVLFTVLLMGDVSSSMSGRPFWAIAFALLPTLIIAAWVSTVSYLKIVRGSRLRLFDGAVLESGFGESEMVFRNPIASVRMSYMGVKSITARGSFVFMKTHGSPVLAMYPRELFPDAAIDRILAARR